MEANELRIGSLIYWNIPEKKNVIHTVIGIKNDKPTTVPISLGNSIEDYQPIPLTPEILEKAGFLKSLVDNDCPQEGYYYSLRLNDGKYCDLAILSRDKNGITEACLFPYENWFRFKYLHQLQNLIHALTGEELDITL
jgi:hypothetical protein